MSVHVNLNGDMVIVLTPLTDPGQDLLDLRNSIIHLVQNKTQEDLPTFAEYRILEFLKALELTEEQMNKCLTLNKKTG